jgi:hypothetical protein
MLRLRGALVFSLLTEVVCQVDILSILSRECLERIGGSLELALLLAGRRTSLLTVACRRRSCYRLSHGGSGAEIVC